MLDDDLPVDCERRQQAERIEKSHYAAQYNPFGWPFPLFQVLHQFFAVHHGEGEFVHLRVPPHAEYALAGCLLVLVQQHRTHRFLFAQSSQHFRRVGHPVADLETTLFVDVAHLLRPLDSFLDGVDAVEIVIDVVPIDDRSHGVRVLTGMLFRIEVLDVLRRRRRTLRPECSDVHHVNSRLFVDVVPE
uniref:(northern house mosquito) hypothetical protein n=1 Tax=Culex pipiens TaxID=7175 RepID=A0A8D8EQD7_CULPI